MQLPLITKLKSKVHRATVSFTNLHYEGSCAICPNIMRYGDIEDYEQISIYNITNGERFTTYAIRGEPNVIAILGSAARKAEPGDKIIICTYGMFEKNQQNAPVIIKVNEFNEILDERNPTIL